MTSKKEWLPKLVEEGNLDKVIKKIKELNKQNPIIWQTDMFLVSHIERLNRQINCVKNHDEIKPITCCFHADTMLLKEFMDANKEDNRQNDNKNH